MFFKFILFGILLYYIDVVHGRNEELQMISLMIDRSMGYNMNNIDPLLSYLCLKKPDLKAADSGQDFILSPTVVDLNIDFTTKQLTTIPSSPVVHLHRNISSALRAKYIFQHARPIIEMTSSTVNGSSTYNFRFVVSVNSADLEGLNTLHLHFSEIVSIQVEAKRSQNSIVFKLLLLVTYVFICCRLCIGMLLFLGDGCELILLRILRNYRLLWLMKVSDSILLLLLVRKMVDEDEIEKSELLMADLMACVNLTFLFWVLRCGFVLLAEPKESCFYYNVSRASIWLVIGIHGILRNWNGKFEMFSNGLWPSNSSAMLSEIIIRSENTIFLNMLTGMMEDLSDVNWKIFLGTEGFRTRLWPYYFTILICYVSSTTFLEILKSLQVPFYVYLIQIALEGVLWLKLWTMVTSIHDDYEQYLDNNPEDLAAGG